MTYFFEDVLLYGCKFFISISILMFYPFVFLILFLIIFKCGCLKSKKQKISKDYYIESMKEKLKDKTKVISKKNVYTLEITGSDEEDENISEIINWITINYKHGDKLVIQINSPGGKYTTFSNIYNQILRLKGKLPIIGIIDKVSASGGYMIACSCDLLYASQTSIIGSIGVVSEWFNFYGFLDKIGIKYDMYTSGKYKRLLTPFTENKDQEKIEKFNEQLKMIHNVFKSIVHKSRPEVDIENVSTGEVWFHGNKSKELGLIDDINNYNEYLMSLYQQDYNILYIEKRTINNISDYLLYFMKILQNNFFAKINL